MLLTSERGLSRSCRAAWFLQRLGHELKEGTEEKYVQILLPCVLYPVMLIMCHACMLQHVTGRLVCDIQALAYL